MSDPEEGYDDDIVAEMHLQLEVDEIIDERDALLIRVAELEVELTSMRFELKRLEVLAQKGM